MMAAVCLTTQLARLDLRIEREILRLRGRYQLSLDEFRGLYVSDEQVDRLVAAAQGEPASGFPELSDRPAAGACETEPLWSRLVQAFRLSPLDEDLLLIASAPELDLKYETLYAYLNNDVTRKWPTADLAGRLLGDVSDAGAVVGALAPGATLRARRLIRHIAPSAGRPGILNSGYALHPCVAHWLHGQTTARALDSDLIVWSAADEWPLCDDAASVLAAPLVRLLNAAPARRSSLPVVGLVGHAGSGRTAVAAAAAAGAGRPLARLDLGTAAHRDDELAAALDGLTLVLSLEPAVVLIEGFEARPDDDHRRRVEARLARAIAGWPPSSLVLLRTSDDEDWRACAGGRRAIELRCDAESLADRVESWKQAAHTESVGLPETELQSLAGRFTLTAGHVRATLATARDLATMHGETDVTPARVAAAARITSDPTLGRLATKVDRRHQWTDLVLPAHTLRRLRELAAAIRHRPTVFGDWGFGERMITGIGIKALFAGSSGTGKTMAAGVIARDLGLDLYKIDLSGIVSKYIGETEKNLDRIFRAARTANAIVFLDEAEAIMGKRSEVKDAHDRYANIEVAYLLQKLEDHDGIVILATNLKRNIDDAFNRRMQFAIDFPRPDEAERERIWRGMFPPQCPLATDVDFAFLARQFDLAGGDIRNVALDAAFLAAQDGGTIRMRTVVDALARQLAKQGKTPTGTDFRQYQQLLPKTTG
jgi:MoxR-like ATPase